MFNVVGATNMSKFVNITAGMYRNETITGAFPLVKPVQFGKKGAFVTVDASATLGSNRTAIRVKVPGPDSVEYIYNASDVVGAPAETTALVADDAPQFDNHVQLHNIFLKKENIRKRFNILDQMTDAVATGVVRGLIVSGPPGVGKSYGVETILEDYEAMHRLEGNKFDKTEVVKGSMTPIGLYQTLYNMKDKGNILVFDDCDSVLFDEVCLNMLKAVLDSGKKRTISWKSESSALRREGIPDRFDFNAGVIFITNVNFENVRSKKIQDHLEALMSRCHYVDLEMDGVEDRFLRIEQIVEDGMLDEYDFGTDGVTELVTFMKDSAERLREISLRMVLKIADLKKMDEDNWQNLARGTCMKRI